MDNQISRIDARGISTQYIVADKSQAMRAASQPIIVNARGTLGQYLAAVGSLGIYPQTVRASEFQCQTMMCYFSEALSMGITQAVPSLAVGSVVVVDVEPARQSDPPLPFCPSVNLSTFYAVVAQYINRWRIWESGNSVQPYIDLWLAQIDLAAREVVRSASQLTREELAFLLLQMLRWKNVLRGGSF